MTVEDAGAGELRDAGAPAFPADAAARVARIVGVTRSGVYWTVPPKRTGTVTGVPLRGQAGVEQQVIAADPGLLTAAGTEVGAGRVFDDFHAGRSERAAVLGMAAATRLGIAELAYQPAIYIAGVPFTVVGIIDDVHRLPELLTAVIVPRTTADALWPALRPEEPQRFKVTAPPDPRNLRDAVDADLSTLFLLLAGVCLIIGAVGIANTTLVAVLERVPEIGLRRALGTVGGLIGTLVGLLAGAYPAVRAARIQPVEALRR